VPKINIGPHLPPGTVEFVNDSGQILAAKQLIDKPVLKFRTLSSNPVNNQVRPVVDVKRMTI
jgi:hypothetical protein